MSPTTSNPTAVNGGVLKDGVDQANSQSNNAIRGQPLTTNNVTAHTGQGPLVARGPTPTQHWWIETDGRAVQGKASYNSDGRGDQDNMAAGGQNGIGPANRQPLTIDNLAVHSSQASTAASDPTPMQRWWMETDDRIVQGRVGHNGGVRVNRDDPAADIDRLIQEIKERKSEE